MILDVITISSKKEIYWSINIKGIKLLWQRIIKFNVLNNYIFFVQILVLVV